MGTEGTEKQEYSSQFNYSIKGTLGYKEEISLLENSQDCSHPDSHSRILDITKGKFRKSWHPSNIPHLATETAGMAWG